MSEAKQNIVILGAGESGVGAAVLAKKENYPVFVSDYGQIKEGYKSELTSLQIEFEEGGHNEERVLNADIVVKSPGIPEKAPIIKKLRDKKVKIISEIEWASWFINGTIVAITGSNGKTTTTSLTYHILKKGGYDVAMAGNIGKSLARTVSEKQYEYYVVEVSSFQLDDIEQFRPYISIITNITEDHLDRYNYNFEEYIASKLSITKNQDAASYCIYGDDDPITHQYIQSIQNTTCIPFSLEHEVTEGAFKENDNIIIQLKKKE